MTTDASTLAGAAIEIVDVFAAAPLEGNPLAVVRVDAMPDAALRQAVARETNLAETTFVATSPDVDGAWPVRIHTPAEELPFAGHPVLGTAWVVRERLARGGEVVTLATLQGAVPVRFEAAGPGAKAWLQAPEVDIEVVHDLAPWLDALDVGAAEIDAVRVPAALVDIGPRFGVLHLRERERLAALAPDPRLLRPLLASWRATGVLAVAPARDGEGDLAVRMFFEANGVREDPATGSANAGLAALHRSVGFKGALEVTQGVEMLRPSRLSLRVETTRIEVGGAVWPVYAGAFASP
ncbi:MAG: PhzF family phenazine biosynthesis protein [Pseudomonadales bacterium]|jgi:trans-2,3-dihydro-3-hydroxyanthranilate isomerase|nr:PhzF family phenazine biosynthesis protein [Pseudomonadales bacterium]